MSAKLDEIGRNRHCIAGHEERGEATMDLADERSERVGTAIRRRREAMGLDAKSAAAAAGLSYSGWRDIEGGRRSRLNAPTVEAICSVLGWPANRLQAIAGYAVTDMHQLSATWPAESLTVEMTVTRAFVGPDEVSHDSDRMVKVLTDLAAHGPQWDWLTVASGQSLHESNADPAIGRIVRLLDDMSLEQRRLMLSFAHGVVGGSDLAASTPSANRSLAGLNRRDDDAV